MVLLTLKKHTHVMFEFCTYNATRQCKYVWNEYRNWTWCGKIDGRKRCAWNNDIFDANLPAKVVSVISGRTRLSAEHRKATSSRPYTDGKHICFRFYRTPFLHVPRVTRAYNNEEKFNGKSSTSFRIWTLSPALLSGLSCVRGCVTRSFGGDKAV